MCSPPTLKSLYRKSGQCAILLLCLAVASPAQNRAPKRSPGPRALGLVQTIGKSARLIPLTIMVDGNLYDASVYRASPRPMALEPGTVYEVQRSGSPEGFFTVGAAQQIGDAWYGVGEWQPPAPAQSAKPAPSRNPTASSTEDQPPILRRSGGSSDSQKSAPSSSPPPAPDKKPDSSGDSSKPNSPKPDSSSSSGSSTDSPSNDDDQRPILRRPHNTPGNDTGATSSPDSSPTTAQEDSGRPVLRRGVPRNQQPQTPTTAETATSSARGKLPLESEAHKRLGAQLVPAISDAAGPEPRPFKFFFKPGEEAQFQRKLQALTKRSINAYEKLRQPGLVAGELHSGSFHAFDVDFSNQPVFVYTAETTLLSAPASARTRSRTRSAKARGGVSGAKATAPEPSVAYTTVVARVNIYGELKEIFSSVTDSRHLDEIPRLQLIDAVDVDGDERGELLFGESFSELAGGHSYVIYRVTTDRLIQLFDTSGSVSSGGGK